MANRKLRRNSWIERFIDFILFRLLRFAPFIFDVSNFLFLFLLLSCVRTLYTRVIVIIAGIVFNIARALYKIGRWGTNKNPPTN